MLFSMIALVIVIIFTGVVVTWNVFWVPVIFLEIYIFSLGLSFLLASTAVFFRDIQYLWSVFISIWMYLSPVIYPVSIIPPQYRWWYDNINPIFSYIQQFRTIILDGQSLPLELFCQGFVIATTSLVIGILVFNRKQNEFILYI